MRQAGYIVLTPTNRGSTNNRDQLLNGKQIIYLEDENGKEILENGKQKMILVGRAKIRVIGMWYGNTEKYNK